MKGSLLPWFLFISYVISSMALSSSSNSEDQDFDPSKPIMQGIQNQGKLFFFLLFFVFVFLFLGAYWHCIGSSIMAIQELNRTMGLYREGDNGREYNGKHTRFESIKAQRGKGSYGGANIVHRGPNEKSAASLIARPPLFITMIFTFLACKLHSDSCFSLPSVSLRCPWSSWI